MKKANIKMSGNVPSADDRRQQGGRRARLPKSLALHAALARVKLFLTEFSG
jgi:hypothetical protein